jgi:hypothetical protein
LGFVLSTDGYYFLDFIARYGAIELVDRWRDARHAA